MICGISNVLTSLIRATKSGNSNQKVKTKNKYDSHLVVHLHSNKTPLNNKFEHPTY